ncbi:MAG: CapA family protein [Peptoniphilaceae bacterium]|nr:CapA family protein [Peptoniphilaceae bacterium]MDY6018298.1 CapA family protein [Anaerococcus sp.]
MTIDKDIIKISFTGDLMCELPLLRECKNFDFSNIALPIKSTYNSDYVVSNLETVFAGKDKKYTDDVYSFNSPDSFLNVVKESQIDLVSTANNHCLDRGVEGLNRTIKLLNQNKIEHTGTFTKYQDDNFLIKKINGCNVGFISYTYGTNYAINKVLLSKDQEFAVNILKDQTSGYIPRKGIINKLKDNLLKTETRIKLKKLLKMQYNFPRTDKINSGDINERLLSNMDYSIIKAKEKSDILFILLHVGGQFNPEPGEFSKYITNRIHKNAECFIVGNHPHIVQKSSFDNSVFTAYSLGNYLISMESEYIIPENNPELSIILHFYIKNKSISKINYSVAFINKDNNRTRINDVYEYSLNHEITSDFKKNIEKICTVFSGKSFGNSFELKKEYNIGAF